MVVTSWSRLLSCATWVNLHACNYIVLYVKGMLYLSVAMVDPSCILDNLLTLMHIHGCFFDVTFNQINQFTLQ